MKQVELSTGDVSELTGIPMNTLDRWCAAKLVRPQGTGKGHGKHRRWSVSQATALLFVAKWREWGAGFPLLVPMLKRLGAMKDDDLRAAFAAGKTHFHELPGGELMKPLTTNAENPLGDLTDYEACYREVLKRIREIERKRPANSTGRNRALVRKTT